MFKPGCFRLTPRNDTGHPVLLLLALACRPGSSTKSLGRGSTFMAISHRLGLGSLDVPHPSLQQQRAIADHLDRETARLDALVAAKERVLGLLAEKRRALITRASPAASTPASPSATPASPGSARFRRTGRLSARDGCSGNAITVPKRARRTLTVSHLTGVTPRSERCQHVRAQTTEGYKISLSRRPRHQHALGVDGRDGRCAREGHRQPRLQRL